MTYTVDSVVCDYGVFEVYSDKNGEKHKDLKLICNSRHNAILIADIMNKDLIGERLELPSVTPCEDAISRQAVLDLLEDTNNGWIINEVLQLPSVRPQELSRDMEEIKEIINCDADAETKCKMISNILTAEPHYFEKQEPKWIPVSERLPEAFGFVNCTCHSLIDDREDWVVETCYLPQLPNSPYSDWGNIPMLNMGDCEVVAWMYRDIPNPYKIEPQESEE